MKRKTFTTAVFSALLLVSALAATAFAYHESRARLSGKNEPRPVKTRATGEATFRAVSDHGTVGFDYMLHVKNIEDVTAAHIHLGKPGESGPPVAVLFNGPEKKGKFSGMLSKGRITGKDLIGPLQGKTPGDLMNEIRNGNAYVNVHTSENPEGEIRGQIK